MLTPGKGWVAQDGAALNHPPSHDEKIPDRPSSPKGAVLYGSRTRSGRFEIEGGRPPAFILRLADRASLRLLVVEGRDRPYSVLFDELGRFAGDDEAARLLRYASGASLETATLSNGVDVADRFRKPDVIAEFFR